MSKTVMNPGAHVKMFAVALAAVLLAAPGALGLAGCGSQAGQAVPTFTTESPQLDYEPRTSTQEPPAATTPAAPAAQAASVESQVTQLLSAFNADREFADLSELASGKYEGRRTGSAGAEAAAQYISAEFSSYGLQPWQAAGLDSLSEPFNATGVDTENIIGIIPGSVPGAGYIILGAHYDHLGLDASGNAFNGADDNAAGVATLLETARIMRETGLTPVKTIVFCSFSGEEEGELGARALGAQLTGTGLAGSVEMINIDGIGATGGDYFGVWDEGTAAAAPLAAALHQAGGIIGASVVEDGTDIGSDAQPFDWQYGIPAVTVDWSWGYDASLFHPYYHTIYDDSEHIDRSVLATASKVAIAGMWIRAVSPD